MLGFIRPKEQSAAPVATKALPVTTEGAVRTATVRDVRLDAVRGLLLVAMTLVHLPGPFRAWVYESLGYVSEAEGFVFLSGLVAGLTYSRTSYQKGIAILWVRAIKRARLIYVYHMLSFILLLFVLREFAENDSYWITWKPLLGENPALAIFRGCTLLYQPRLLDILPMYCLLILLAPLAIQLARSGRGPYLLIASSLLWSAAQPGIFLRLTSARFLGLPMNLGAFDIFAWQFLFITGLYLGFIRYRAGEQKVSPWKPFAPYAIVVSVVFLLLKHGYINLPAISQQISLLSDKQMLGPLRIINFFAISVLSSVLLRFLKPSLIIHGLAYLGRHSLQVFSYHILLVHFVDLFVFSDIGTVRQIAIAIVCVASLYLPAWLFEAS